MSEVNKKLLRDLDKFSGFNYAVLHSIGKEAKKVLWQQYLSGQSIRYTKEKDVRGRRLLAYSLGKRKTDLTLRSYPLNIWEKGYNTSTGKRVRGRHVFRRFGRTLRGQTLVTWVEEALDDRLDFLSQ